MKQEGAKNDLAMNSRWPAARRRRTPPTKLDEAAKDVGQKLDQKKGQEANDQAALQPNKVDPMHAAQQVPKAIEQANKAAEKADEADKALNPQPMNGMQPMAGMPMADMPMAGMPMDGMPR